MVRGGDGGSNVLAALQESNVMVKRDGSYKDSTKLCWIAIYLTYSSSEYYPMELPGVLCRMLHDAWMWDATLPSQSILCRIRESLRVETIDHIDPNTSPRPAIHWW